MVTPLKENPALDELLDSEPLDDAFVQQRMLIDALDKLASQPPPQVDVKPTIKVDPVINVEPAKPEVVVQPAPRVIEWVFDFERNPDGTIKRIIATAKEPA